MLTFVMAAAASAALSPMFPTGVFNTPVDKGQIRLERCGEDVCGRALTSDRLSAYPDQRDVRNVEPGARTRRIKGLLLMRLHPIGPGRWGNGKIYNPDDGRSYSATLTVVNADTVKLKGCLFEPLCRTQTWTRSPTAGTQ